MSLAYEKRFADFATQLITRHYGKVLPGWAWHRVLLWLPTIVTCILRPIRVVLGFCAFLAFVPLLLWPPFWRGRD